MIQLYNSLTRQKEPLRTIEPNKIKMYVCGMTVYDYCHIGHARMLVTFDMVTRYFRERGYDVTYVRNITDIDDKIIQRANENQEQVSDLTARFIRYMHEDIESLGVLPPDIEPRATESIDAIITLIEKLIEKNVAYVSDNGDVYYDVSKFEAYGQLANKSLDDLRAGARVEVNENKRSPLDFVLWKAAKPHEPEWPSPWGSGRPGWHIECSAMSMCHLGESFDIHGGGLDLKFPHHENEIAQSEAATKKTFVGQWIHNGFVQVNEEKMSKSLGNFFTIRDVRKRYPGETIRYFILASHYRSPLHYSDDNLQQAHAGLERLYNALRDLPISRSLEQPTKSATYKRFTDAMDDDFNTPVALSVLFELVKDINKLKEHNVEEAAKLGNELRYLAGVLGLLSDTPEVFLHGHPTNESETIWIEQKIAEREQARVDKDWSKADQLRDELKQQGILLEDKAGKTIWRRL